MAQSGQSDPGVPAKVTEIAFEPAKGDERFWDSKDHGAHDHDRRPHRPVSFSGRMFNVGWKGWTRLALVCVMLGAVFQAGGFNPFAPGFTIGAGLGQIVNGVINIAAWAAQNGGVPLILGALAVLPFWLLWRALVTLVNRDRPPGPDDRILPKERQKKPRKL